MVTELAKAAIDYVLSRQECQNGGPAQRQSVERHFQAPVVRRIVQPPREDVGRILFPVSRNIYFREIQVQLRLTAIHPHRGVAEFFRLRPFLLGRGDRDTHIGNVIGIAWLVIESRPQMRQRPAGVTSTQEREAGPEFLECLEVYHAGTLRWVRAPVEPAQIVNLERARCE